MLKRIDPPAEAISEDARVRKPVELWDDFVQAYKEAYCNVKEPENA